MFITNTFSSNNPDQIEVLLYLRFTLCCAALLFVPVRRERQLYPAVGAAPLAEPRGPVRHSGIQVTIVEFDTGSEFGHLFRKEQISQIRFSPHNLTLTSFRQSRRIRRRRRREVCPPNVEDRIVVSVLSYRVTHLIVENLQLTWFLGISSSCLGSK